MGVYNIYPHGLDILDDFWRTWYRFVVRKKILYFRSTKTTMFSDLVSRLGINNREWFVKTHSTEKRAESLENMI